MGIERMRWPRNKVCAAMISVNLDAEFFAKIYFYNSNHFLLKVDLPVQDYIQNLHLVLDIPMNQNLVENLKYSIYFEKHLI